MKKFDGKSNAYGKIIEKYRKSKKICLGLMFQEN